MVCAAVSVAGSFPGESILCEITKCLLESVSGAVIDQLEFVIL